MQTERNTKKNPVFLLFPRCRLPKVLCIKGSANRAKYKEKPRFSFIFPFALPSISHYFLSVLGTYLGLTWDLHRTYLIISLHIKMATSRTHPEHIPNIKNVISIIKNRGRSCAHISLTPYLYMIPRFFVAVIHGVEV